MTTNNPQPAPRKRLDEYVGENAQPLPVRGGKRNVKRRSAKSGDPRADRARSEKREV